MRVVWIVKRIILILIMMRGLSQNYLKIRKNLKMNRISQKIRKDSKIIKEKKDKMETVRRTMIVRF